MPASASEAFLLQLAETTFLKPWVFAGPTFRASKELCDLAVPFGDDVVVFSDKAIAFQDGDPQLAWSRWHSRAVDGSIDQLKGAMRRLDLPTASVFTDAAAKQPLPFALSPAGQRRYHLVAVARPAHTPGEAPEGWQGLRYTDTPTAPFEIGPREVGGVFVHVFDGDTIDLLLRRLDTAPDFIAYLASRAETLAKRPGLEFEERDLLAHATTNWMAGRGFIVDASGPTASRRMLGLWDDYIRSDRAAYTAERNAPSRVFDDLILHFHDAYLQAEADGGHPDAANHEAAMRILASETRIARRMIVDTLAGLLDEPKQDCFWAKAFASPSTRGVTYVLLTCPAPPPDTPLADVDARYLTELSNHLLVAAIRWPSDQVVGLVLPDRANPDPIRIVRVLATEDLDDARLAFGARLQAAGVFADIETTTEHHAA